MNKKTNKGFSLLELLIVVAIILVIATIAIPNLLRPRLAAHEASAIASLRTINSAELSYLTNANGKYGLIPDLIADSQISSNFNPGPVSGYNFAVLLDGTRTNFTVTAEPASANDGRYGYYMTPDGSVRYSTLSAEAPTGMAGAPVGQ